jgi:hypothetical protein
MFQIHYNERKYPNMPYQNRHCGVLLKTRRRPCNVLVMLREGKRVVVPSGNLCEPFTYKGSKK